MATTVGRIDAPQKPARKPRKAAARKAPAKAAEKRQGAR